MCRVGAAAPAAAACVRKPWGNGCVFCLENDWVLYCELPAFFPREQNCPFVKANSFFFSVCFFVSSFTVSGLFGVPRLTAG